MLKLQPIFVMWVENVLQNLAFRYTVKAADWKCLEYALLCTFKEMESAKEKIISVLNTVRPGVLKCEMCPFPEFVAKSNGPSPILNCHFLNM